MSEQDPKQGTLFGKMVDAEDDAVQAPEEAEATAENQSALSLANFSSQIAFDNSDIIIPRLRCAQGLTSEVQDGSAKPGQWLLTGHDPKDEITIVPLLFARNRNLRDSEGNEVLCKSTDGITGVGAPGGTCASCPMNKWADGSKGERIPPACVFSYVYICFCLEFQSIALIEFRRTSLQAGKTLNTLAAQKGLGNFGVKMKSSKQTGKRGTFYQMVVQPVNLDRTVLAEAQEYLGG